MQQESILHPSYSILFVQDVSRTVYALRYELRYESSYVIEIDHLVIVVTNAKKCANLNKNLDMMSTQHNSIKVYFKTIGEL